MLKKCFDILFLKGATKEKTVIYNILGPKSTPLGIFYF